MNSYTTHFQFDDVILFDEFISVRRRESNESSSLRTRSEQRATSAFLQATALRTRRFDWIVELKWVVELNWAVKYNSIEYKSLLI